MNETRVETSIYLAFSDTVTEVGNRYTPLWCTYNSDPTLSYRMHLEAKRIFFKWLQ